MKELNFIDKNATQGIMIINGQTINLFDLQPRQVSMPKMVRGLQGVIRFNGYSDWSVAQHSFLLSHIVERVCLQIMPSIIKEFLTGHGVLSNTFDVKLEDLLTKYKYEESAECISLLFAYDALIHDFSEALTGDIIRPYKKMIQEIGKMEDIIDSQIRSIHGALPKMPLIVDLLDKQLATVEAYYLTRFYGKSLLDELDDFHIKSFNSSFVGNEPSIKLKKLMGLEDVCDKLPISDKNLNEFLSFSKISINEIKSLSNEDFITAYIDRAVNISKRIKNEGEKRRK